MNNLTVKNIKNIASLLSDLFCFIGVIVLIIHWFGYSWLTENQITSLYNITFGYCFGQVSMGWRETKIKINLNIKGINEND